jgi:hypothetical protein
MITARIRHGRFVQPSTPIYSTTGDVDARDKRGHGAPSSAAREATTPLGPAPGGIAPNSVNEI